MFKRIVFNQFHDLKKQGKDPLKARFNAILLVSILLLLAFLNIYFVGLHYNLFEMPNRPEGVNGKFMGKILGLVFLGVVFLISYVGVGKNKIAKYYEEFEQLDESTQQSESKKGMRYFVVPMFVLVGFILFIALSSM